MEHGEETCRKGEGKRERKRNRRMVHEIIKGDEAICTNQYVMYLYGPWRMGMGKSYY